MEDDSLCIIIGSFSKGLFIINSGTSIIILKLSKMLINSPVTASYIVRSLIANSAESKCSNNLIASFKLDIVKESFGQSERDVYVFG